MLKKVTIHILEPTLSIEALKTVDSKLYLSNEFSKKESTLDLKNNLEIIAKDCILHQSSLDNYRDILLNLKDTKDILIFNLCDGTELDGYPGASVIQLLDSLHIPYTGSNLAFYLHTTSKPTIKNSLIKHNIPTSPFITVNPGSEIDDIKLAESTVGYPMIVKPSVSYASLSISSSSITHSFNETLTHIQNIQSLHPQGIFIEQFLPGQEFTVLITGDVNNLTVYPPVERVFNSKLKESEKLLAFDSYWDGYVIGQEAPDMDAVDSFYWYEKAPDCFIDKLKHISRNAYLACGGTGYGRVDIRSSKRGGDDFYVLEVNANCGLSFIKGSSTTAEILRLAGIDGKVFLTSVLQYAIERRL